ncbi:MAG: hypothetical protein KGI60_02695 [Patescibacteria group bacterium]|nr:hypothetical protein [Patescibacteria group bacterium]
MKRRIIKGAASFRVVYEYAVRDILSRRRTWFCREEELTAQTPAAAHEELRRLRGRLRSGCTVRNVKLFRLVPVR